MNKRSKFSVIIVFSTIIMVTTISNILIKKVTANELNSNNSSTIVDANITIQNQTTTSLSTRKAPVSIVNYSDEVTESSDTYDYSIKDNSSSNTDTSKTIIQTTPTPIVYNQPTPTSPATYQINPTNAPVTNVTITPTPIPTTNTLNQNSNVKITKKIFIGDSRTVHMKLAVGSTNDVWSCKSAMGLKWLKSTGVPAIENQITNGTAVIILMGVNDLYNTNNYIQYLNEKAIQWSQKGAVTYYVSVNPINEASYTGFKNTKIETFNNAMQSGLKNINYIDTYNYLITHDTSYTSDGLHYNNSTSKKIYELINNEIN